MLVTYINFFTLMQELPDVPLFLSLHNLCATLKCTSPSAVIFRSAVINAGYRISGTHVNPLGLKSDAPMDVIWDIMRCWVWVPWLFFLFDQRESVFLFKNLLALELGNLIRGAIIKNENCRSRKGSHMVPWKIKFWMYFFFSFFYYVSFSR